MDFRISKVEDCQIFDLPIVHKESGNITAIENLDSIPFAIKRTYYLYDVPGGEERGGHAHKQLQQLIVAASGAFEVVIDDGISRKNIRLDRPNKGLYLVPGIWRELINFSSGSICLVLASEKYSESDYIRDFAAYKAVKQTNMESL